MEGFFRRHPEWGVAATAAGGWVAMIVLPHPHAGHHGHGQPDGPGALAIAMMVVAMMLPLTLPSIRHAALSGAARGHRAIGGFVTGYLAVWMVGMLVITVAWTFAASLVGWMAAAAGTVALAALWEAAPPRHRLAHQCTQTVPLTQRGWRGDAECARFGAASGVACVGTCWALMAACVAFAHSLPVMVALFGVQAAGRYGRRPVAGLTALAVLAVGLAAVAMRAGG